MNPTCFLWIAGLLAAADARGTLELKFMSLTNEEGLNSGGGCCDKVGPICMSECDPYMDICVDDGQFGGLLADSCTLGLVTTGAFHDADSVVFGDDIEGIDNPIIFKFDEFHPDGYRIDVDVWDHDPNNDDFIEDVSVFFIYPPAASEADALTIPLNYHGVTVDISIEARAFCDPDYYSENCAVFCQAHDDTEGHYDCSSQGERVCHPGWTGEFCSEDINDCESEPCENGGSCEDIGLGFRCFCTPGYTGETCGELAYGHGTVSVRLLSYDNPTGTEASGNCCDGYNVCHSECDHYIHVCLDDPNGPPSLDQCTFGSYVTDPTANQNKVEFGDVIGDVANPMTFSFTRWNLAGVLLKADVYDDDSNSNNEFVDYFISLVNILPGSGTRVVVLEERTKLTLELTVECDEGYGGPLCTEVVRRHRAYRKQWN